MNEQIQFGKSGQDHSEVDWAQKTKQDFQAATAGNPMAMYELASEYEEGLGREANVSRANYWYRQAMEHGYVLAKLNLGYNLVTGAGTDPDPKEGFRLLEEAAADGNPMAPMMLASIYERGLGTPQNFAKAAEYYQAVMDKSNGHVLYCQGMAYLLGRGAKQDVLLGVRYLKSAAEMGDMAGECELARCLLSGTGIKKNPYAAVKLLKKSVDLEYGPSCTLLGDCRRDGQGGKQDPAEAFALYQKATEVASKDREALLRLAACYRDGFGTEQDETKAAELEAMYQEQSNKA